MCCCRLPCVCVCSCQTEHDFNLEKQMLVHNATVKINEEYSQKEKNKEIEERMYVELLFIIISMNRLVHRGLCVFVL